MGVAKELWSWRSYLVFILAPILVSPVSIAIGTQEAKCAYVIIVMAVYWISECLPVGVTALLPVVFFPFFEILSTDEVSKQYMNNINMLFLGGLVTALAIEYWNLHKRVALRILTLVGSEPRWIMLGMMLSTWFLSMWISNTAAAAMMVPITEAILIELRDTETHDEPELKLVKTQDGYGSLATKPIGNSGDGKEVNGVKSTDNQDPQTEAQSPETSLPEDFHYDSMAKGLLLSICFSANCGGIASLTGTGPNLILKREVDELFESNGLKSPISFGKWMLFGVPMSFAMLVICWCWLQILFLRCRGMCGCCRRQESSEQDKKTRVAKIIREQYDKLGPLVCGQVLVGILFVCMVILWVTRDMGGVVGWGTEFEPPIKDGTSAILICILMFALPSTLPFLKSYPNSSHPETDPIFGRIGQGTPSTQNQNGANRIRPLLRWSFVAPRFPWGLILLLGGGFSISAGCKASGLSPWIGNKLTYFQDWNQYAILLIISYTSAMATEFASNTAMASILMPILKRLALSTQIHPIKYMLPACFACSFAFMLPVATPPNAIVFSSGRLRITDMLKAGILVNLIAVPVLVGMIMSLGNAVYDIDHFPPELLNVTSHAVINI